MNNAKEKQDKRSKKQSGTFISTLCAVLGILIISSVILTALPLTVPRLFGIKIFRMETSDMSPELPQNSAVYVSEAVPEEISPGEVVAHSKGDSVACRRVVQNRVSKGEIITNADAAGTDEPETVPYRTIEGRVTFHLPLLGSFLPLYTGRIGMVYVLLFAASGIMLLVISGGLRKQREGDKPPAKGRVMRRLKTALAVILLITFLSSGAMILYYNGRYRAGRSAYSKAAEQYTKARGSDETESGNEDPGVTPDGLPPITVDFSTLCEFNPDVVGWLFCPDTPINYPVLRGENNDTYLRRGLDGSYLLAGSIFVDSKNRPDFSDSNTVIYGHNMKDDSMFSCLEEWEDQAWYEDHPVIWLLTPERNYRIEIISGHLTDARSDCYQTVLDDREGYVSQALDQSDFQRAEPVPEGKLVLLSTCANESNQIRYVLHGVLVPVGAEK